jgi:hypothetical protein
MFKIATKISVSEKLRRTNPLVSARELVRKRKRRSVPPLPIPENGDALFL